MGWFLATVERPGSAPLHVFSVDDPAPAGFGGPVTPGVELRTRPTDAPRRGPLSLGRHAADPARYGLFPGVAAMRASGYEPAAGDFVVARWPGDMRQALGLAGRRAA